MFFKDSREKKRTIIPLNNEIEANIMQSILEEKNLPHVIVSYRDNAFDGIFQFQNGWGHIETKEEYVDEILEIHGEIKA